MTATTYTAQQALDAAAAGTITTPIAILDNSSAIQSDLDALKPLALAGEIASISFSDSGTSYLFVQGTQAINDLNVLSLFQGAYNLQVNGTTVAQTHQVLAAAPQSTVSIYDSASNILANLDGLQAIAGKLQSIACNDQMTGALTLTQAQLAADPNAVAKLFPGNLTLSVSGNFSIAAAVSAESQNGWMQGLTVVDSLANLEAALPTLPSRPALFGLHNNVSNPYQFASLTLTDSGTLALVLPDSESNNAQGFLSVLTNQHTLDWTGVPIGHVAGFLNTGGQPSSLIGSKVEVRDTAATVSSALDALKPYDQAGQIGSITIIDGNLPTYSASQATSDAGVLAKITVAGIPAAAAVVEAGQLAAFKGVLVQDNTTHVAASLDGLESLAAAGKLAGITLIGSGTQTLTITAAQQTADAAALAAISSPYQLVIGTASGGGTVSSTPLSLQQLFAASAAGTLTSPVPVLDGMVGVQSDLDALKPLALAGEISSISLTDANIYQMYVQAPQAVSDLAVLSLLQGSYDLDVQNATIAQMQQLHAVLPQAKFEIYDSSSNVAADLDGLLAINGQIGYVNFSDQSGTLTLTQAQLAADSAIIARIDPYYVTLSVSGTFSVAQAIAAEDLNGYIQGLTVVDSLADLQTALKALPARPDLFGPLSGTKNPYQFASVTLTDSGTPTIVEAFTSYSSYANINGFLSAITNRHSVDWTGVPIGWVSTLLYMPTQPLSLAGIKVEIGDTAATVSSALDALLPYDQAGQIGSITIIDGNLPTFTAAQANADASVLAKITVADMPAAAAIAEASQLQPLHGVIVQDNATHIVANLDGLESLAAAGKLDGITLIGPSTTLTVSAPQLASDAAALSAVTGTYQLDVTPVAGAAIKGIDGVAATVDFSGNASDYSLTAAGNGHDLTVSGTGGTYQVSDVQALHFADHQIIVAATPGPASAVTGGNITEIYGAVFGREPDVGGLAFYQAYLKANPGTALTQFAQWFLASPEYANNTAHNYAQTTAGDAQFITDSYQNLLGRTPGASEVAFYQNVIAPFIQSLTPGTAAYANAEAQAHALVLTYFSQSPEFLGDVQVTAANPVSGQHWLLLI